MDQLMEELIKDLILGMPGVTDEKIEEVVKGRPLLPVYRLGEFCHLCEVVESCSNKPAQIARSHEAYVESHPDDVVPESFKETLEDIE